MPQDSSKSFRDTLLIPIVVGIVIAIATYLLPKFLEKGRQVSYTVDGPTTYLTQQLQGVAVTVNGTSVPTLFITRVHIWNSGKDALVNLPVLVFFATGSKDFKLLSAAHETQPEHEFGNISEEAPDYQSKKFTYQLLNPNDADTITLLTNDAVRPSVYAKAEGLRTKAVARAESYGFVWSSVIAGLLGIFSALLGILSFRVTTKKQAAQREMLFSKLREETERARAQAEMEMQSRIAAAEAQLAMNRQQLEKAQDQLAKQRAEVDEQLRQLRRQT